MRAIKTKLNHLERAANIRGPCPREDSNVPGNNILKNKEFMQGAMSTGISA